MKGRGAGIAERHLAIDVPEIGYILKGTMSIGYGMKKRRVERNVGVRGMVAI